MTTHFFKLEFDETSVHSVQGGACVVLGDHFKDKQAWPVLTHECGSEQELTYWIEQMKGDLEPARTGGRSQVRQSSRDP